MHTDSVSYCILRPFLAQKMPASDRRPAEPRSSRGSKGRRRVPPTRARASPERGRQYWKLGINYLLCSILTAKTGHSRISSPVIFRLSCVDRFRLPNRTRVLRALCFVLHASCFLLHFASRPRRFRPWGLREETGHEPGMRSAEIVSRTKRHLRSASVDGPISLGNDRRQSDTGNPEKRWYRISSSNAIRSGERNECARSVP